MKITRFAFTALLPCILGILSPLQSARCETNPVKENQCAQYDCVENPCEPVGEEGQI